jgi:hypothetical protein
MKLQQLTTPLFFDGIISIYKNVKQNNKVKRYLLKDFQSSMTDVSKWSSDIIKNEHMRFKTEVTIVDKLILSVFQIDLVLRKDLSKNAKDFIPKPRDFIHQCYLNIARALWKQPFLVFDINVSKMELQKNKVKLEKVINTCIRDTFLQFFPIDIDAELTSDNEAESVSPDDTEESSDKNSIVDDTQVDALVVSNYSINEEMTNDDTIIDTIVDTNVDTIVDTNKEDEDEDEDAGINTINNQEQVEVVASDDDQNQMDTDTNTTSESDDANDNDLSTEFTLIKQTETEIEPEYDNQSDNGSLEIASESDEDASENNSDYEASSVSTNEFDETETDLDDDDESDNELEKVKALTDEDVDLVLIEKPSTRIETLLYEPRYSESPIPKATTRNDNKAPEIKEVYIGPKQHSLVNEVGEHHDVSRGGEATDTDIKLVTVDDKKTAIGTSMLEKKMAFLSLKKKAKSSLLTGHKPAHKDLVNTKKATSFF